MTATPLHPGAWWLWGIGMAVAAAATTNLLLLGGLSVVLATVAGACAPASARSGIRMFAKVGVAVVLIRLLLEVLVGSRAPGTELFALPTLRLPVWMAGIDVGGPVTVEGLLGALARGLQLAVVLVAIGVANSLAGPARLLAALPAALYETGVVVSVALTTAPGIVAAVGRVHQARRLRGRPTRGLAGLRGMALPVFEDAVSRSVELAASMDSRGYGRRPSGPPAVTWLLVGAMATVVGLYGLLAGDGAAGPLLLVAGATVTALATWRASRRDHRSRHRRLVWDARALAVAAAGAGVVAGLLAAAWWTPGALDPSYRPLAWPTLPWPAVLGLLWGLAPALWAPALDLPARPARPIRGSVR